MIFLIVDPVLTNSSAMQAHLKKMGYVNHCCKPDGFQAINHLRKNPVDFVISRMNMQAMSGTDLLSELQNDYQIHRRPFLIFDERLDEEDHALVDEFGADAFLSLPFITKDLAEKVMQTWSKYLNPKDPEFYFERARRMFLAKDFSACDKIFTTLSQSRRLFARAALGLAKTAKAQGKIEEALRTSLGVVERNPGYVHAHQFIGEIYLEIGPLENAVKAFCDAIALSPKNPYRYQIVSEILSTSGQWAAVINILEQAEKRELEYNFVAEGLAAAFLHYGNQDRAIKYYEKLVAANPKTVTYLNNMAICLKKQSKWAQAIECYKRALEIEPKDTRILYNLGLAQLDYGKPVNAVEIFEKLLKIDPQHEKARLKILQLNRPTEYKLEMKRLAKIKSRVSEYADLDTFVTETTQKLPKLTSNKKLDTVQVQSVVYETTRTINKRGEATVPPLVLAPALKDKISALTPGEVRVVYYRGLKKVRSQLSALMNIWLEAVCQLSGEIALDICKVSESILDTNELSVQTLREFSLSTDKKNHEAYATLANAIKSDQRLKDALVPMLTDLQMQDYLRQTLDTLKSVMSVSLEDLSIDELNANSLSKFVSEDSRLRFREIVLGEKNDEADFSNPGDMLLF